MHLAATAAPPTAGNPDCFISGFFGAVLGLRAPSGLPGGSSFLCRIRRVNSHFTNLFYPRGRLNQVQLVWGRHGHFGAHLGMCVYPHLCWVFSRSRIAVVRGQTSSKCRQTVFHGGRDHCPQQGSKSSGCATSVFFLGGGYVLF